MEEGKKTEAKFVAIVTGLKGTCTANHTMGQRFELHCYDSGGLCGFFYKKCLLNTTQLAGWMKTGSPKAMEHDIRWA